MFMYTHPHNIEMRVCAHMCVYVGETAPHLHSALAGYTLANTKHTENGRWFQNS